MAANAKIRKEIIERDQYCQRCNKSSDMNVHHIIQGCDGGEDTHDNLITLCAGCHLEWHVVEQVSNITFKEWLTMPTMNHFFSWFKSLKESKQINKMTGRQVFDTLTQFLQFSMMNNRYAS